REQGHSHGQLSLECGEVLGAPATATASGCEGISFWGDPRYGVHQAASRSTLAATGRLRALGHDAGVASQAGGSDASELAAETGEYAADLELGREVVLLVGALEGAEALQRGVVEHTSALERPLLQPEPDVRAELVHAELVAGRHVGQRELVLRVHLGTLQSHLARLGSELPLELRHAQGLLLHHVRQARSRRAGVPAEA